MGVEVRDMDVGDCDPLSRIVCDVWSMDLYGEGLGIPGSRLYLLDCLRGSTLRRTAVVEGEVVGCVVARSGDPSDLPDPSG